jgi:protein O-mannosyl-transferase
MSNIFPQQRIKDRVILIIFLGFIFYHNCWRGSLLKNSQETMLFLEKIGQLWPMKHLLTGTNQPLVDLSFALQFHFWKQSGSAFFIFNQIIHVLAALVLFAIVRQTLNWKENQQHDDWATDLAAIAATLWMVHPLQTESVAYLLGRSQSLMGLFFLLTVYAATRYFQSPTRLWLALCISVCALGMLCQPGMGVAPLTVLLYDRIFIGKSLREIWQNRNKLYLGLSATWMILGVVLASAIKNPSVPGFDERHFSPGPYALTQPGVILHYLRLTFWPVGLVFDYDWPIAQDIAAIFFPLLAVLGFLIFSLFSLRKSPALGFWGIWFFLTLLPTSSIFPWNELAQEQRMYLPLAGIITVSVLGGYRLLQGISNSKGKLAVKIIISVIVLILGYLTLHRNNDYRDPLEFWKEVTQRRPANVRAFRKLAVAYLESGDEPQALQAFLRILQLKPDDTSAHINAGNLSMQEGQVEQAREHFKKALLLNPNNYETYNNYAVLLMESGERDRVEELLLEALRLNPRSTDVYKNLGNFYYQQGDIGKAIENYSQVLKIEPNYLETIDLLGNIYLSQGNYPMAEMMFLESLRLNGRNSNTQNNLGKVYLLMGKLDYATLAFVRAIELDPENKEAKKNLDLAISEKEKGTGVPSSQEEKEFQNASPGVKKPGIKK